MEHDFPNKFIGDGDVTLKPWNQGPTVFLNTESFGGHQYLASIHFNHLESPQGFCLFFHLRPESVELLIYVLSGETGWCRNRSRKPFAPWSRVILVNVNIRHKQRESFMVLWGICWHLYAFLLWVINTETFGHGAGWGEGAPWSLQPLLQGGTQLLMRLWKRLNKKTMAVTLCQCTNTSLINTHDLTLFKRQFLEITVRHKSIISMKCSHGNHDPNPDSGVRWD